MKKNKKDISVGLFYPWKIFLIFSIAFLNLLTYFLVLHFKIPLFLDTWATALGTLLGGLPVGIIGGVLYNVVLSSVTGGPVSIIWALSSILIAIMTWVFWERGWMDIKKPKMVLVSGLITGFFNGMLTLLISFAFFDGLPTFEPTAVIWEKCYNLFGGNIVAAGLFEHMGVEIVDKTLVFFIAAFLLDLLTRNRKKRKNKKPALIKKKALRKK